MRRSAILASAVALGAVGCGGATEGHVDGGETKPDAGISPPGDDAGAHDHDAGLEAAARDARTRDVGHCEDVIAIAADYGIAPIDPCRNMP